MVKCYPYEKETTSYSRVFDSIQLNYHFVRTKKLDKWYTFILEQMKKSCETSDYKPFKDNEFVEDFDAFFYSFKDQAEGAIDTAKQFVAKMREFL